MYSVSESPKKCCYILYERAQLLALFLGRPIPLAYIITLGVRETSGIEFSTTVIAYPRPQYVLKYENGTTNSKLTGTLITNGVNNYTFNFNQTLVKNCDFGTYHLQISNQLGQTIVYVNIIPQSKLLLVMVWQRNTFEYMR